MAIVISDESKAAWMYHCVENTGYPTPADWHRQVHLYASALVLGSTTTLASLLSVETGFTGYGYQPLVYGSTPGINSCDQQVDQFAQVNWTAGGGGANTLCYGYWVDGLADGGTRRLLWCEAFPVAQSCLLLGAMISFQPQLALGQAVPC